MRTIIRVESKRRPFPDILGREFAKRYHGIGRQIAEYLLPFQLWMRMTHFAIRPSKVPYFCFEPGEACRNCPSLMLVHEDVCDKLYGKG